MSAAPGIPDLVERLEAEMMALSADPHTLVNPRHELNIRVLMSILQLSVLAATAGGKKRPTGMTAVALRWVTARIELHPSRNTPERGKWRTIESRCRHKLFGRENREIRRRKQQ